MQLYFNVTAKRSDNAQGVRTRVPGWGSTEVIEYLDPSWTAWLFGDIGKYMKPLVDGRLHGVFLPFLKTK